ncbi:hypothetical protein [Helicobacter sp. UBA3407]|uniref:hypothetical protein n=2 Tax=Helicobacteraceae TaxID=72293 RepID=UPI0023D0D0A4|nr:hypothetical protein [Helicobacter sp. UBA3407]MDE6947204.1 hypothetical protein [Anaeroplasmataceae bacterium]
MQNKPLTYNRFGAYLRYKTRKQHFSKMKVFLIFIIYILFSFSCFLLPLDILTKYPYLKYFTDFMDFIPAIKLMETKTFAPELCKFYASYMFIVLFGCFVAGCYYGLLALVKKGDFMTSYINHKTKNKMSIFPYSAKYALALLAWVCLSVFLLYAFLSGGLIGLDGWRGRPSSHFINDLYDLLYYSLESVLTTICIIIIALVGSVAFFELRIKQYLRKRNGQ